MGQTSAKHTDFLGRLCSLIPGSIDAWLNASCASGRHPLSMPVKMLLMLSLSQQMQGEDILEEVRAKKIEWISELWYAFDPADVSVVSNSANMCSQLTENLDRVPSGNGDDSDIELGRLKRAIKHAARLL